MLMNVQAIYLLDRQELYLSDSSVTVPPHIAETVDPDALDLRYLAHWARETGLIGATAEVSIAM